MHILRCNNGHFYDGDKYGTCPHCGASAIDSDTPKKEKSGSIFGKIKSGTAPVKSEGSAVYATPVSNGMDEKTELLFTEKQDNMSNSQPQVQQDVEPTLFLNPNPAPAPSLVSHTEPVPIPELPETPEKPESSTVIADSYPHDSDETVGFFGTIQSVHQGTYPMDKPSITTEPVVGWLVCVKGKHFGAAFNLFSGRNSVGRDYSNRVCIPGDNTVSSIKHLWITYEPKKREFFVQPGESSGLVYLNGENIMSSVKVEAYNRLEIGAGEYMLVPLCCDQFSWEDVIK